jgi:hypothetical protein
LDQLVQPPVANDSRTASPPAADRRIARYQRKTAGRSRLIHAPGATEGDIIRPMSDLKTMPAALAELLRPRRLARVRRTVARSRAEGALFDAVLWSMFALVFVTAMLCVLSVVDVPFLAVRGVDKAWLVAGGVLVAIFGAGALWWRWFKWHVYAADFTQRAPGSR